MSITKDYRLDPADGGRPDSMVVLLHGVGANGQDLLDLGQYWQGVLPRTVFISPDAPFAFDMEEFAPGGRQWFSLAQLDPHSLLQGVKTAAPHLQAYLDGLLQETGLTSDRMALVGFSQGTMMALYAAFRRAGGCAGVVGYSGALMGGELLTDEALAKPPVLLIHGEADPVVPVMASRMATQQLQAAGIDVTLHTVPGLPHSIDQRGLQWGGDFLSGVLYKQ